MMHFMTTYRKAKARLASFRQREDGAVFLIEFALIFPLYIVMFLMTVELSVYTIRQVSLDRGLDIAVRFIRLNTNTTFTHSDVKDLVCENFGGLDNCDETLRIEMITVDPRNFSAFDQEADCIDSSEEISPVRGFTLGQENQMMMVRACVKFDPVYPTSGLGKAFAKDGSGQAKMISVAAFVQEPS